MLYPPAFEDGNILFPVYKLQCFVFYLFNVEHAKNLNEMEQNNYAEFKAELSATPVSRQ